MSYDMTKAFNVKFCPICNKDFVVADSRKYIYKRRIGQITHFYCCYSHYKKGKK